MPVRFALAAPEAVHIAVQPVADASVYAMSAGRLGATVAALVGLTGVVVGGLALARPTGRFGTGAGRFGTGAGRLGAFVATVAGLIAMALGGLVVATSDSGIGTGNGRGGAFVALLVGLIGTALGGLALARSRRAVDRLSG
ncbi:DUF6223 family protein [Streptomyces niveus]|uniref:DUF6223 family protein n=1 Tax=Streptomyces niveus TaxID=193462 RepID=UPI003634E474